MPARCSERHCSHPIPRPAAPPSAAPRGRGPGSAASALSGPGMIRRRDRCGCSTAERIRPRPPVDGPLCSRTACACCCCRWVCSWFEPLPPPPRARAAVSRCVPNGGWWPWMPCHGGRRCRRRSRRCCRRRRQPEWPSCRWGWRAPSGLGTQGKAIGLIWSGLFLASVPLATASGVHGPGRGGDQWRR